MRCVEVGKCKEWFPDKGLNEWNASYRRHLANINNCCNLHRWMGGGEKRHLMFVNEMKQANTWDKENLDLTLVFYSLNEVTNI
jgi:hypothetical protein